MDLCVRSRGSPLWGRGGTNTNTHTNTAGFWILKNGKTAAVRARGSPVQWAGSHFNARFRGLCVCAETERLFFGSLLFSAVSHGTGFVKMAILVKALKCVTKRFSGGETPNMMGAFFDVR